MTASTIPEHPPTIRVVHVANSLSRLGGGVAATVWQYASHGRRFNVQPTMVTMDDPFIETDAQQFSDIPMQAARPFIHRRTFFSPQLKQILTRLASQIDVIHCHGLWRYHTCAVRAISAKLGIPVLLSPHGMLDPYPLQLSGRQKSIARILYEDRNIRAANALHACALPEAWNFRNLGFSNPIAIVPNGIELHHYSTKGDPATIAKHWPQLANRKILLYLSRIQSIKGLPLLVQAWSELFRQFPDWHMVIAGPDEQNHTAEIQALIHQAGANECTTFTGPVLGEPKFHLFSASHLFVLPSYSENFGIVVAEALASAVPVITTDATPWSDLVTHACGWRIPVDATALRHALQQAMSIPESERQEMGLRGRSLVEQKYTAQAVAMELSTVYRWLADPSSACPKSLYPAELPANVVPA